MVCGAPDAQAWGPTTDLTPGSASFGERVPFKLTIRADAIRAQPTAHALVLFPAIHLEPLGRYGLVLTDRVLSQAGEPLAPSSFFEELLGEADPGEAPEVAHARPLAEQVVEVLEVLDGIPSSPGCVGEFEGHFCAQVAPEAHRLRADFYRSAVENDPPVVNW